MAIEIRIHRSIQEIPEADWNRLEGIAAAPFLSWTFLSALERTGCVGGETGWYPFPLSFWDQGRMLGAAPVYLKHNSEGEFVFDHAWASAAHRAGIRYYPKLIVAVPFTPATAPRLLAMPGTESETLLRPFAAGLRALAEKSELSGAHVLFPTEAQADALEQIGFAHRLGIQFHWINNNYNTFDDFLARFSSKRRNQIKRERREMQAQNIQINTLRGKEITPEIADFAYEFYLATVDKFYWGRRYLNRAFFEEICSKMSHSIEIVTAREGKKFLAGAFNIAGPDVLFGRYWGAREERPFLHFNVCYYHTIDECIQRKMIRFEAGAGGSHKLARGFEPRITHSAHLLMDPRLDTAVRDYLEREREVIRDNAADTSIAWR